MEARKPKGFGKFDRLMKKLVKVPPEKGSADRPQKCTVPGCRNLAEDSETICRGCREHFGQLEREDED